jgi:hypothetical protein
MFEVLAISVKYTRVGTAGPGVRIEQEGGSPTGLFAPSLDLPPPKVPRRVQVSDYVGKMPLFQGENCNYGNNNEFRKETEQFTL